MYLLVDKKCSCNYNPDFLHEARTNNWVFEIIKMDNNIAKIKSKINPSGYWEYRLNTFDKIVPDRRIDYSMNDLDIYFEI